MVKLYGIGVGPGDPELITMKAVRILKDVDVAAIPVSKAEKESVALSIARPYLKKDVKLVRLNFPMIKDQSERDKYRKENAGIIKALILENKSVVFLTLGDPLFYSTFIYLLEYLENEIEIEVVPGIYSFSAISSKMQTPLCKGDETVTVFTSFNEAKLQPLVEGGFGTIVFMKVSSYNKELALFFEKNNLIENFIMVSNYGMNNEKVVTDVSELKEGKVDYLSTLILKTN